METIDDRAGEDRALARRDALALMLTGPLVTAVLLSVWVLTGRGYFWPMWPMAGMSIAVLVAIWRAFGPLPQTAAGVPPRGARRPT